MVITEEINVQFLFSNYRYTQKIELNVKWQITVLIKKVNIDF